MPTVITIGNFDGVHKGHRLILAEAKQLAAASGGEVLAMTFDPHPASVLRPGKQPPRLMTCAEKVAALRDAGADRVEILTPTAELLDLSPEAFIERIAREHQPIAIVEGPNFRFGKDRAGDETLLRKLGEAHGFAVRIVDRLEVELSDQLLAPLSSSLIRWLIGRGRVADAARCLAQPYALTATVIEGEKRGRTIGVPTANLDLDELGEKLIPCDGVYAGNVMVKKSHQATEPPTIEGEAGAEEDTASFTAAISVGVKPTFGQKQLTVEAHLLDFAGDLYGQTITVAFHRWLREQQPFPSFDALKAQIDRDLQAAADWGNRKSPEPAYEP